MPDTTVIILAGGRSTRMGQDKGLMMVDGKRMVQHIIDTVLQLTKNILIIANNPKYGSFGLPTYADIIRQKGPLAGIVTGLSASQTEKNWVISCDTPYVSVNLLKKLMEELTDFDAVIPKHQDKMHPLIATYKKKAMPLLQKELGLDNLKLMEANRKLNVNYFNADQFDVRNFKNINSKADL